MRIRCVTQFDITATGVKSNFNKNRIPFVDDTGTTIEDHFQWQRSRNKQRNWETINQIISLRALPTEITVPEKITRDGLNLWQFEFEIDSPESLETADGPTGVLAVDCKDVPMLTGLEENAGITPLLELGNNIVFDVVTDK